MSEAFLTRDWIDRAKEVSLIDVARRAGASLKKMGGEWVGPCLACGGKDRFSINPTKNVWNCRGSEGGNGSVDMAMHLTGCIFLDAVEMITGEKRPEHQRSQTQAERTEAEHKRAARAADNERRTATQARLDAVRLIRDGEAIASILERAGPFPGSRAEDYLIARGAGLPKSMTRDLRFVGELHYWGHADNQTEEFSLVASLPAMVAIIRAVNGDMVGVHITYLDAKAPTKWIAPWEADLPPYLRRNPAKKQRKTVENTVGAMIRLGAIGEMLVMGEGIETVGSYFRRGFAAEDASFGVAISLGRIAGGAVCQIPRPPDRGPDGKALPLPAGAPATIPNGIPDRARPGVILPVHVKRVVLLGDGDSDPVATRAALLTGARRYRQEGREVVIDMAPPGDDFASMPREIEASST